MLNDEQKVAAYELNSDVLVSASPGTGKTRTLVARAQRKLESMPEYQSVALITYTNAAADEIASRLITEKSIFIGTIHRFCLEFILRPFGWLYGWEKPRVVSYDEQLYFCENTDGVDLGLNALDNLGKISLTAEGNLNENVDWSAPTDLAEVAEKYFSYLEKIGAIDFNQILYRSFQIVSKNEFVAQSLGAKFFEILVDEFQDTNEFQYDIFKHIKDAGNTVFFMVGDERQSIYRFAGAIQDAFERATPDFSATNTHLTTTYRSSDNIVNAYSKLFEDHPEMKNEAEHKALDVPVIFRRTTWTDHDQKLNRAINYFITDVGIDPSEIAVLSQRWSDAYSASKALRTNFDIVGLGALPHSTRNLGNSTFHLMRSLGHFLYRADIRALRSIKRGIDLHMLENNLQLDDDVKNRSNNALITKFRSLDLTKPLSDGLKDVEDVFNGVFNISHSTPAEILSRINEDEMPQWNLDKYIRALSSIGGITSNTIHQAKGLEYDVVILNHMNAGRIPYQKWDRRARVYLPASDEDISDGRNLFYVATSRAKKYLVIFFGNNPSMFVPMIK